MAIFDALTGAAGHQAADSTRSAIGAVIPQLLGSGSAAYGTAGNYLQGGYDQARGDLGQGYGAATGAINTGYGNALGAYAPLSALASQYGQGAGLYADSLGINGPQGNQRAVSAFQTGPGYQFAFDQGTEALNRQANLGGISGNTLRDTFKYGQGLANQEYGKYQDRLAGFNPLQLSATQGAAAGNAALNVGQGNSLADLAKSYYGGLAGLSTGSGNALAGNTIAGNANNQNLMLGGLQGWNNTYAQDAKASEDASRNAINLGIQGAKLAASAAGGGAFGDLGSLLGGGSSSGGYGIGGYGGAPAGFDKSGNWIDMTKGSGWGGGGFNPTNWFSG